MHVTIVHVHVKTEYIDEFLEASRINHEASVQEEGNLRFDVLQMAEDPSRFVLYEAYMDADAAAAHKKTDHYMAWREKVADWMAESRQGVMYHGRFPKLD
jgi:autoinducer 2-degrading protein